MHDGQGVKERCETRRPAVGNTCAAGWCWRTFDGEDLFCGDDELNNCVGLSACESHGGCGGQSLCADTVCGFVCRRLTG